MDYCPKCGFSLTNEISIDNRADLNFCPKCGFNLNGFQAEAGDSQALEGAIIQLLQKGKYFEAITLVRMKTKKGLKESKEQVNQIASNNNIDPARLAFSPSTRFKLYLIVAAFFGLMVSSAGIALFPPLGYVSKPFLCDGNLLIDSRDLKTPAGYPGMMCGTETSFHCRDGQDRTLAVIGISTLVYTCVFLLLFLIRGFFKSRKVAGL